MLEATPAPLASLLALCLGLAAPVAAQCSDSLSAPRSNLAATSADGVALFAGGTGDPVTDRVDLFEASSSTWSVASLSAARSYLAALSLGPRAYFAGGGRPTQFFQMQASDVVDVYDRASGSWSVELLSEARWNLVATTAGGLGLFAGGYLGGAPPMPASAVVDIHDPLSGGWTTASLSQARSNLAATHAGALALFAGGGAADSVGNFQVSAAVDLYDSATGAWMVSSLSQARAGLSATSVGDLALFAGGWNGAGESDVVDIFDSSSGIWSSASLSQARSSSAAFSVGSFAVFAGGRVGSIASDVVDVFDAATGQWFTTRLGRARYDAAATTVAGQALIGGGRSASGGSGTSLQDVERLLAAIADPFGGGAIGCPCGNHGSRATGCTNSTGAAASLELACAVDAPPAGPLRAQGLLPFQPALLVAGGSASTPTPFGDGLLVLGGPYVRLGVRQADASGGTSWPIALLAPGSGHHLQAWYRDSGSPCGMGSNLTNGLFVLRW